MIVAYIVTVFNLFPILIWAQEIDMEKPVTELKVRELIEILRQQDGGTWIAKDSYTVITGLSSPHRYRICNDIESEASYITIDIDGTHDTSSSAQIIRGNCRDYEVRQYLRIKPDWPRTAKGTYRDLD